jgi:CRISPR-associated protein Csx17
MDPIVFEGVSPRSLGDLLKGYGLIAVVGERCTETRFWWDDGFHLIVEVAGTGDATMAMRTVRKALSNLPQWAEQVASAFQRTRQKSCDKPLPCPDHPNAKKKSNKKNCPFVLVPSIDSPLKAGDGHDSFDPSMAEIARAAAIPRSEADRNAEPHPWFPSYGQDGSGNYFVKLGEAAASARRVPDDLEWSLFGIGSQPVKRVVDKGYLFFPEPTTRYATGVAKWEQEKAAVSAWCFLLALRGALLLRGSLRRPRWRRAGYPAFPFVFDGAGTAEVHLPTWSKEHPRSLRELLLQVRQFHAPLTQRSFAVTAAEFRAAVQRRGPAVAFDTFHRYLIEARRPGQQQRMPQAIPRGLTRAGLGDAIDLRGMIAPLGESGWIDQLLLPDRDDRAYALEMRRGLDKAIHCTIDEGTIDSYLGVLESVWELNRALLTPGKLRRVFEKHNRKPSPAPPLPFHLWERALAEGFGRAEWRISRALGSIVGVRAERGRSVGPILEQMLPVRYSWDRATWTVPENAEAASTWSGRVPLRDFQLLLWRRWLVSDGLPRLPFAAARTAPLDDVLSLLRGKLDLEEIHRLTPLFAQLSWQDAGSAPLHGADHGVLPQLPAYTALRLWLELGIAPGADGRPPRDGEVPRFLSLGGTTQVEAAGTRALARLRVQGLPWHAQPAPMGKAVVNAQLSVTADEAERMALAVLVPISRAETLALSRRFLVAVIEKEISA